MSVILFEGFDNYGNFLDGERDIRVRRDVWTHYYNYTGDTPSGFEFEPRNNGNAMRVLTTNTNNLSSPIYMWVSTPYAAPNLFSTPKLIGGFAYKKVDPNSTTDNAHYILSVCGDNRVFQSSGYGYFYIYFGGTVNPDTIDIGFALTGGSPLVVPNMAIDQYHYIEFELTGGLAPTGNIWINNRFVGSITGGYRITDFTSLFLHPLKSNYHPGGQWYDDLYLLDGNDDSQGATYQSRLGPIIVRPTQLIADGSPSQWAASSGGAKYQDVDEIPGESDLDVTTINTQWAPRTQMFKVAAQDTQQLIGAYAAAVVKQDYPDINTSELALVANDGTEEEYVFPDFLQNKYRMFWKNYVTMPNGDPLTKANIEAASWGVRTIPTPPDP